MSPQLDDEENRLVTELEKCARALAIAKNKLFWRTSSALLDEQQKRLSAVDQARSNFNRAFAECEAYRNNRARPETTLAAHN